MGAHGTQISVSPWSRIGVFPMHRGHHSVWLSNTHQVDVCNMTDDLMVRELMLGHLYRFPLTHNLFPWVISLFSAMNVADDQAHSPWLSVNSTVRKDILDAVRARLIMQEAGTETEAAGGNVAVPIDPLSRNTLEPGMISPTPRHPATTQVAVILRRQINLHGAKALVE